MTDFTYKEYEKFIEDSNLKLKESYNFKKLANILFNEMKLKSFAMDSSYSPFNLKPAIFLNKKGYPELFKNVCVSEGEYNKVKNYYNYQLECFKADYIDKFYRSERISFLEQNTDFTSKLAQSLDELSKITLDNKIIYEDDIARYCRLLKKAKLVTINKIKNTNEYKFKFKLTKKEYIIKYFVTKPTQRNYITFEETIKDRVKKGEDYIKALEDEALKYIEEGQYFKNYIFPEIKNALNIIATSKNEKFEQSFKESFINYLNNPNAIIGPFLYKDKEIWTVETTPRLVQEPYIEYNRLTNEIVVHNINNSQKEIDYAFNNLACLTEIYIENNK